MAVYAGSVEILPETFLRGYDPVTILYPSEVSPEGGGPLDDPSPYLTVDPPVPGEFRFIDGKTIQFRPSDPWPPLRRFIWTVGNTKNTLITLMTPPERMLPASGSRGLDEFKDLTLEFREAMPPEGLSSMLTFELRPLPGIEKEDAVWLTGDDFDIKELHRGSSQDPARYLVTLHRPVGPGFAVTLHIRLALSEDMPHPFVEYEFRTKDVFRITAVGAGRTTYPVPRGGASYTTEQAINLVSGNRDIFIEFNAIPVDIDQSALSELVRFSPSVERLSFRQSGTRLILSTVIEEETMYRVELEPTNRVHDSDGRPLIIERSSVFHFYVPKPEPFVQWEQSHGILERYGPQELPVRARGTDRIDLRIHQIDPDDRRFWPFPNRPLSVDERTRPPGPGEEPLTPDEYRNRRPQNRVLEQRIQLLEAPIISRIVELPAYANDSARRFGLPLNKILAEIAGPNRPGTYLIGYRPLDETTARSYVRVQVTDLSLGVVERSEDIRFVVTSLKSGQPVRLASVKIEGFNELGRLVSLAEGYSDDDGYYQIERFSGSCPDVFRVSVRKDDDILVIDPRDPPPMFANNHWYGVRGQWFGSLCTQGNYIPAPDIFTAHVVTERPMYRPGEPVHIKGYIRSTKYGDIQHKNGKTYTLEITDPSGKESKYRLELTPDGTFYQPYMADEMPSGTYWARVRCGSWRNGTERWLDGVTSFQVESYRVPTFEVRMHGPDTVPMDEPFAVSLTASYYAGGRVSDQQVEWRATQYPYAYRPAGFPGFEWSSTYRYSRPDAVPSDAVLQKTDRTDEKGSASLAIDPTLEVDGSPRRYVVETTVIGADEQTVSATKSVIAVPAFSLGLQVERYIRGERIIRPTILVVGVDEKPLQGQQLTLKVFSREWHSHLEEADLYEGRAKYVTDQVDTEIMSETIVSSNGPDSLEIPVSRAGVYVVKLEARDKLGRPQVVSADLYVAGDEEVAWEKPRGMVFDCIADRDSYDPFDTAHVVLKSPFQSARALAVIEHPKYNEYRWIPIRGGKADIDIVLAREHVPQLPVHFLLMRGRGEWNDDGSRKHDLKKPVTMASSIRIPVSEKEHRVAVELEHPERAMPRDTVSVAIHLADAGGNPLDGEVTLWLVDQAVLALGEEKPLDPLPTFLPEGKSNVRISDTRNRAEGLVLVVDDPGGGGMEAEMAPELLDKVTVRKEIVPVPYYNQRILVDESGFATVTFVLPDNVTNFKLRAIACSGPGRFGIAKSTLAVRLPMVVQSALPRFVRPGDSFVAGGIGRVVEGAGGPGWVRIKTEGLSITGDYDRRINWIPGKAEKLMYPISVAVPDWDETGERNVRVTVSIIRDIDGAGDALQVDLPVRPDRRRIHLESIRSIANGMDEPLPELPERPRPGSTEQQVTIASEEAVLRMAAALDYLMRYPYGCTEQRISQAFPLVALKDFLEPLGLGALNPAVKERVDKAIEYLKRTQSSSGLYGYWNGSHPYVYLTAYVAEFLVEAKEAGLSFPEHLLTRANGALQRALRSDYGNFVSGRRYIERADALYALARSGLFDESYGIELLRKNQYMDAYGKARVAMAFSVAGRSGLARNLEEPLWEEAVFRLRDGREVFSGLQKPDRGYAWGGILNSSEIKSTAWLLRALVSIDPTDNKIGLMTRGVVDMGDQYGWGNTWNNASCMLALGDIIERDIDRGEDKTFSITFGEKTYSTILNRDRVAVSDTFSVDESGTIRLEYGKPDTSIVARMAVSFVPAAPGDSVSAVADGFVVSRELTLVPEDGGIPRRIAIDDLGAKLEYTIGDIVEEHIRVVNPEERHFVAVTAPFAAGFEPLNPELAISGPEATPSKPNSIEPSYMHYTDDSAGYYFETLPKGSFDFYFRLRATFEGSFVHPAASAEMMYRQWIRGNAPGARVIIHGKPESDD